MARKTINEIEYIELPIEQDDFFVVSRGGEFLNKAKISDLITKTRSEIRPLSTNYTLTQDDSGVIFDILSAINVTIPVGLTQFTASFIPPDTGNITFVVSSGVSINGVSANVTRSNVNNIVELVERSTTNVYKLTGI